MRRLLTVGTATFATFALGAMLAVLVAGSASAASPTTGTTDTTTTAASPGDSFLVLNGTVNAASDHEILASSAFPNFTSGAVDNYYSLAHAHVDNSPFAQGTASPFDTGPIGQTAAAGNTQQPQYADARWPGDGKAEYGSQGGPHAVASAGDFKASADASLATNALSGPSASSHTLVLPKGLDGRIRMAIAAWKAKWQRRLDPQAQAPAVPVPKPKPTLPKRTVTTPVVTVTTPATSVGVPSAPAPTPVQVPPPPAVPAPTVPTPTASAPSRSLAADSTPTDGETLLSSSTKASLVPGPAKPKHTTTTTTTKTKTTKTKTTSTTPKPPVPDVSYALVTSGESSLGRVSLGGGQIVIEKIHVTASITNDGTPTYKAAVTVGSASIGGVPVTIDEDGVHLAGQGQALPYRQASDALNSALKQAGIQLFLVGPEVTTCGPSGGQSSGTDTTTTTTTSSTTTTSTDQSGSGDQSGCGQGDSGMSSGSCDQSGSSGGATGLGTTPGTTTASTNRSDTTTTSSSCDQTSTTCDQMGTSTGTGTTSTTTTASAVTTPGRSSSTSTSTTPTPSDCGSSGTSTGGGLCSPTGTGSGSQPGGAGDQFGASSLNPLSFDFGASNAGEQTVDATGVHVVFTQPVNQPGVPSQQIEHILGEVFVDSLATPLPDASSLDLSAASAAGGGSCLGAGKSKTSAGGSLGAGGGSSAGGSAAGGSLTPSASGFASGTQPLSGSTTGTSLPAAFALALRKPLWLLLAYLVWQALVIGTGVSLWQWRRGDEA